MKPIISTAFKNYCNNSIKSLLPKASNSVTSQNFHTCTFNKSLKNNIKDIVLSKYNGPRLKIRIPKPKLSPKLNRIRNGKSGVIRSQKELTIRDIESLIASQREGFSHADISKLILAFPQKEQELATKLLARLTQFGSYSSLDQIVQQTGTLYFDSSVNLGSVIRYLSKHEGAFSKAPKFAESKATCIVDELLLQKMETNSSYLREILSKDLSFVIPEGFSSGLNPFNQTKSLKEILKQHIIKFKELKLKYPDKSEDEIISELLNQSFKQRLEKLGIKDAKVIRGSYSTDINSLVEQLNGKHISAEELNKILAKYPEKKRQYILEILARSLTVPNSKEISKKMQIMHKMLVKLNGGSDKGIYYVIPQDTKSYSIITMQYQLINNISPRRIITLEELSKQIPKDAKSLVVLDDLAGSGESLQTAFMSIYECLPKEQEQIKDVFLMPMLSTKKAFKLLNKEGMGKVRATCIPTEIVESIQSKQYWSTLSEEDQIIIKNILDGSGFGGDNLCVCLPYLGPDNNCSFFSKNFAQLFTLNGSGIKRSTKKQIQTKESTTILGENLDKTV